MNTETDKQLVGKTQSDTIESNSNNNNSPRNNISNNESNQSSGNLKMIYTYLYL